MNKYSGLLRYVVLTGVFVLPFIVFIVMSSMFFPFITGKNFAFRFIVEIIFAAWLILAMIQSQYRPKKSWVVLIAGSFIAWIGIANIFGVDPSRSFWSNFERMEGYITMLHLLAYLLVAMSVMQTERLWKYLFNTSIAASILLSFYGLSQLSDKARIDATLGNSTYLGVYMLFHVFLTLILLYKERSIGVRWFYGASILLQLFILFKTGTRGTLLGLIGALFLSSLFIAIFEREQLHLRKIAIGGVVGVLVLIGAFLALKDTAAVQDVAILRRIAGISLQDATTRSRFLLWTDIAWEGVQERPLLGWGQENFNVVFNQNYNPRMYDQEQWFDRSHNVIVDWSINAGIPGMLLYLGLYGVLVFVVWRARGAFSITEQALLIGLLAGYFVHNLFVFDNLISHILFWTIMAYVHSRSVYGSNGNVSHDGKEFSVGTQQSVAAVALIGLVIVVYATVAPGYRTSQAIIDALREQGGTVAMAASFERALAYDSFANQEVMSQYYQFANRVNADTSLDVETQQSLIDAIQAAGEADLIETPKDARSQLFHGIFLQNTGQLVLAEEQLLHALTLSPTKQTMMFPLIQNYLIQGKLDEALVLAQEAFELDEGFGQARRIYLIVAGQQGNIGLAKELMETAPNDFNPIDNDVINIFANAGEYDILVDLWTERVAASPGDVQARVSLAATYNALGDIEAAVAVLNDAIVDIPDFAEQGEELISQIQAGVGQ